MKKTYIIMLIVVISFSIYPSIGGANQSINKPGTYRILVDQNYGFYKVFQVYNAKLAKEISSENRTLNINKGDTVVWINDAIPDRKITIVNKQNLWNDNNGTLKWSKKQFSYSFNKSGMYDIYIKEHTLLQQKIIVGSLEENKVNSRSIKIKSNSTKYKVKTDSTKTNSTKYKVKSDSTTEKKIVSNKKTELEMLMDMFLPNSTTKIKMYREKDGS